MSDSTTLCYEWKEDLESQKWDTILASLCGHPLQSAKWGDAKMLSNGTKDKRWAVFKDGKPIYLIRFEERYLLKYIKIAWVPRGFSELNENEELIIHNEFLKRLKQNFFSLCIMSPYKHTTVKKVNHFTQYTIWLDLKLGTEKLWANLHTNFRRHVRNARRNEVLVEETIDPHDIHAFYKLCTLTSLQKKFSLHTSEISVNYLISKINSESVSSHLFVARYQGKLCGGLFVIRCGESVHNWLAAVDRDYSKLSIGEILHWEVAEWAVDQKCKLYDLEGISDLNSSTDRFKKKLGGTVITFPGEQLYPLHMSTRIFLPFMKFYLKLQVKIRIFKYYFLGYLRRIKYFKTSHSN